MTIKTAKEIQSLLEGSRNNADLREREVIALEAIADAAAAILYALAMKGK